MLIIASSNPTFMPRLLDESSAYLFGVAPKTLVSFKAALDTHIWRQHYDPFSCVIIGQNDSEVILVRDHIGLEPLYYWHQPGKKLVFGQTLPDILKHLPHNPSILESQMAALFSDQKNYSDETIYQGVYRVEPGHLVHFKPNGSIEKRAYWQLERDGMELYYNDEQDYLDHFSSLLNESIQHATKNQQHIAAEFSAGLDSSAVYCAAVANKIKPKLYMHIHSPDSKLSTLYNEHYENAFIDHYELTDIK